MAIRKDTIQLSIEINGVKAGQTYKQLRDNARDLTRELDKANLSEEDFIKKSTELKKVNNVLATIRASTRGVAQAMEEPPKKVNPLIDAFKKGAAASLAFFSVQRILQWGKELVSWAIKGTAALESMERKTAIVFGDAIDIVEDYAAINAQALGVTETKYASLAASIGDILIPMGFQREQAAKLSSDLTNLSGALSEWSNGQRSAEEVSKILAKALTGERESLKELGIVITEADISSRLLAKGQKELTGSALQQAKALINYELILEKSKDAQTAFAINQEGIARSSNRISSVFNQLKENILQRLIPAFKSVGNAVADVVAPLERQSDLVGALQAQFNVQIETLQRGNISQDNRRKLIEQINLKYKEYLPNLITEKTTLTELRDIQEQVNEKFTQRILLLATEESLRDVSRALIEAKRLELDIAQQQIAAEQELAKFDVNKVGQGREGADQAFIRAATAAQAYTDKLEANQKEQARLQEQFDKTAQAARELGLDLDKILNPEGATPTTPTGDPSKKSAEQKAFEAASANIEKLKNKRIEANERIVQSDEQTALKRKVIELEAQDQIDRARLQIFSNAKKEEQRLTIAEREKLDGELRDREIERLRVLSQLSLQETTELIEQTRALRIAALDDEALTVEAHGRRLEIINREFDISIAEAKLHSVSSTSEEYVRIQTELREKLREINNLIVADTLATAEQGLAERRDLAILALDELELDEVSYNTARERINLEADIDILKSRLALNGENTEDRLAQEIELADKIKQLNANTFTIPGGAASSGGFSTQEDRDTDEEAARTKAERIKDGTLQVSGTLADAILTITRNRIDEELRLELDAIDRLAEKKRAAAGEDSVQLKKIDAEARLAREAAEKKAARERKKVARSEAIIQGALAVIEALPNAFAAVAAGIASVAQLAIIDSQSFAQGGHTGSRGLYRDKDGHDVTGVVHTDEYVIPSSITRDPAHQPVISYLEQVRRSKGGFADGGYTTVSTRPAAYVHTVTSTTSMPELKEVINVLNDIRQITAAWPTVIKAVMAYTDFERTRDTVENIRGLSQS